MSKWLKWSKEKYISYAIFSVCSVLIETSELTVCFLYYCFCYFYSPMFMSTKPDSSVELTLLDLSQHFYSPKGITVPESCWQTGVYSNTKKPCKIQIYQEVV